MTITFFDIVHMRDAVILNTSLPPFQWAILV